MPDTILLHYSITLPGSIVTIGEGFELILRKSSIGHTDHFVVSTVLMIKIP